MDDIDYLRSHGEVQSFVFMVDSKQRDRAAWPTPSEYVVPFVHPFANVVGLEMIECSVPRTNYNVDDDTNTLRYCLNGTWTSVTVDPGDYDVVQLCTALTNAAPGLTVAPTSSPPEIKSTVTFTSSVPFQLDMGHSSMEEVLGFDELAQQVPPVPAPTSTAPSPTALYAYVGPRVFGSVKQADSTHVVTAPGIYSLIGERYILLRCPEIEDSRSAVTDNYVPGIAKIRLGVVGYAINSMDFVNAGVRSFHPIGRLSRLTFRFERSDGTLYNFRGVNHTMTFVLKIMVPKRDAPFVRSSLNPNYDGNVFIWKKTDEEREGDSDDDTDAYNASHAPLDAFRTAESRALPENQAALRQEMVRTLFA